MGADTRAAGPEESRKSSVLRAFFDPAGLPSVAGHESPAARTLAFRAWYRYNTAAHKVSGYRAVFVSLKKPGVAPGDVTDAQLELIAELADRYSFGEARVTHTQNLVLADVEQAKTFDLWRALAEAGLATPNIGTLTDMICCPDWTFAASPTPAPSMSRGSSTSASTITTISMISARSKSRCRAA